METGVSASEWLENPRDMTTAVVYLNDRAEEIRRRRK